MASMMLLQPGLEWAGLDIHLIPYLFHFEQKTSHEDFKLNFQTAVLTVTWDKLLRCLDVVSER